MTAAKIREYFLHHHDGMDRVKLNVEHADTCATRRTREFLAWLEREKLEIKPRGKIRGKAKITSAAGTKRKSPAGSTTAGIV